MAGIAGLVSMQGTKISDQHTLAFKKMSSQLYVSEDQSRNEFIGSYVAIASVAALAASHSGHFLHDQANGIICAVDGIVYLNKDERRKLSNEYGCADQIPDIGYLPYLFLKYGSGLVNHLTGWYNVAIHNQNTGQSLLFNDRLGLLPLYVYECVNVLLFSSRIEAILSSGILCKIEFDACSMAEYLLFNYTLSDNTFINQIHTFCSASLLNIRLTGMQRSKYWSASELLSYKALHLSDSLDLVNQGLHDSLNKVCASENGLIYLSLTGGWDSRLVLSCLIAEHRERLRLYSFGANGAPDIIIPSIISQQEKMEYQSIVLDQAYLDNEFLLSAQKTIVLSSGTRHYKRAHYLFAVEKICSRVGMLVSGIYGDQALKVTKPHAGEVLTENMMLFIDTGFNASTTIEKLMKTEYLGNIQISSNLLKEQLYQRLYKIGELYADYDKINEKFFVFRYELNLRKYFGAELNSYNDYALSHSPFIDYDFLTAHAQTCFFFNRYNYFDESLKAKKMATQLYYKLIAMNYKPLTKYITARGYRINDAGSILGWVRILGNKCRKKMKQKDSFNTIPTDNLFYVDMVGKHPNNDWLRPQNPFLSNTRTAQINSLHYWLTKIESIYV